MVHDAMKRFAILLVTACQAGPTGSDCAPVPTADVELPSECWTADWCAGDEARPWLNDCGAWYVCPASDLPGVCSNVVDCDCLARWRSECGAGGAVGRSTPVWCTP